jgi:hypothetical protein
VKRLLLVTCLAMALSGCGAGNIKVQTNIGLPACPATPGDMSRSVVLMAQSVPTAGWLPCVRALPVGWTFADVHARDGSAYFALDSDREGAAAARIAVSKTCDVGGATEIPSEQSGMRRYERVTVADGGCITYGFRLNGSTHAEPITAVTSALGFVDRASVRRYVHDHFGGLELDGAAKAAKS